MARFLRSMFGNPVQSGLEAFITLGNFFDTQEQRKQEREMLPFRREMMGLQMAGAKQRMKFEEEQHAEWRKQLGERDDIKEIAQHAPIIYSAFQEQEAAKKEGREPKYTPDMLEARDKMIKKFPMFADRDLDDVMQSLTYVDDFIQKQGKQILAKGGVINDTNAPDVLRHLNNAYRPALERGTDQWGLTAKDGVKKKISSIILDPKTGQLAYQLEVTSPIKEGQVFKHRGTGSDVYTVNPKAEGMIEKGNIDLSKRPVRKNADGSISTLLTTGFGIEENGKEVEVLVPMISDSGKVLTPEEARKEYEKTGKHLGKFSNIADASRYAEQLHSDKMWDEDKKVYSTEPGQTEKTYKAPMTFDRAGGDPNSTVLQHPAEMLATHVSAHTNWGRLFQSMEAKAAPQATLTRMMTERMTETENKAASEAMSKVDTSKSVDEQRKQFITEFTKNNPHAKMTDVVNLAKTLVMEKQPKQYLSRTRQEGGKKIFEESHDQGTTWKKVSEGPAFKPSEPKEPQEPAPIKEFKAVEKMTPDQKKRYTDFQKEKAGGKSLNVTEQREIKSEAFGRYSYLLPKEGVQGRTKIIASKDPNQLISNLPTGQQETVREIIDRATEIKQEDRKKTTRQAFEQAEKEIGKPKARPSTSEVEKEMKGKPRGTYKIDGHLGVWDGENFEWR